MTANSGQGLDCAPPAASAASAWPRADDAQYRPAYCAELDEAEVIRQYAPMVKRLALHLKGRLPESVQLDDLIQAGLIAVLRTMRRGGIAAVGPAPVSLHRTISNAMIDEARRDAWAPVRTIRLAKAAGQAMRAVKARLGRDGADDEIAAEMGITLDEYHALLVEIAGIRLLQLDEFGDGAGELRAPDDQHASLDRRRRLEALVQSIAALPEREKLVLSLYYEHELNMSEVGKVLGVDKSTVCRVHGRALLMLRGALADWAGERPPPSPGE
jgi:RNA polymerase sigma factor for flagellar operon FliA